MTDLLELAIRCEKATGPDRSLDCDIFCATAPSPFASYYPDCVLAQKGGFAARVEIGEIPGYTASIDDAMTLTPKGWTFANLSQSDGKGWWCELRQGYLTSYDKVAFGTQLENASPALAICAAALRARAST